MGSFLYLPVLFVCFLSVLHANIMCPSDDNPYKPVLCILIMYCLLPDTIVGCVVDSDHLLYCHKSVFGETFCVLPLSKNQLR